MSTAPIEEIGHELTRFDNSWRHFETPSGVKVSYLPTPQDLPLHVSVSVAAGAAYEGSHPMGTAHFLEHMLFRGSESYPAFELLASAFEALGADWNAATGVERTEFWVRSLRWQLTDIVALMGEFIWRPQFKGITDERRVIEREIAEETVEGVTLDLSQHARALAWPMSPQARPILGTKDSINQIILSDIEGYWASRYTAGTVALSIVGGDCRTSEVEAIVEEHFSPKKAGISRPARGKASPLKNVSSKIYSHHIEWEDETFDLHMAVKLNGKHIEKLTGCDLIRRIMASGHVSRLNTSLKEKQGLFYHFNAQIQSYSSCGLLELTATVDRMRIQEFIAGVLTVMADLASREITEDEVNRAQQGAISELALLPSEREKLASRWGAASIRNVKPSLFSGLQAILAEDSKSLGELAKSLFRKSSILLVGVGSAEIPFSDGFEAAKERYFPS